MRLEAKEMNGTFNERYIWLIHTARDRERDRDRDRDGYNRKQWLHVPVPLPV